MKFTNLKATCLGLALLACSSFASHAASLGLSTDTSIAIEHNYVDIDGSADFGLSVFAFPGTGASAGLPGFPEGFFTSVYDEALDIFDEDTNFLTGTLSDTGFVDTDARYNGVLELLFDVTGGTFAAEFGDQVLMTLTANFGSDPFNIDFGSTAGTLSLNPVIAAVPLPAGLPLLLGGFGCFALLRRRA